MFPTKTVFLWLNFPPPSTLSTRSCRSLYCVPFFSNAFATPSSDLNTTYALMELASVASFLLNITDCLRARNSFGLLRLRKRTESMAPQSLKMPFTKLMVVDAGKFPTNTVLLFFSAASAARLALISALTGTFLFTPTSSSSLSSTSRLLERPLFAFFDFGSDSSLVLSLDVSCFAAFFGWTYGSGVLNKERTSLLTLVAFPVDDDEGLPNTNVVGGAVSCLLVLVEVSLSLVLFFSFFVSFFVSFFSFFFLSFFFFGVFVTSVEATTTSSFSVLFDFFPIVSMCCSNLKNSATQIKILKMS
eukprot:m.46200 g.46200  ORF g.46200 m.46200 type:complete len:302 (-) comp10715_c0_seq2:55-960(-)